ncbi:transposase [Streptomyces litchfieldiae]|uniref:transposase n=1 Tax=Streptomyces litchfieldiae TaxID=3075543 RepID=UPI00374E12B6
MDRWWPEIAAFIATGHSNARSEGINRMIKLVARAAHGFRWSALARLGLPELRKPCRRNSSFEARRQGMRLGIAPAFVSMRGRSAPSCRAYCG